MKIFSSEATLSAFQYMQQAVHQGKIVMSIRNAASPIDHPWGRCSAAKEIRPIGWFRLISAYWWPRRLGPLHIHMERCLNGGLPKYWRGQYRIRLCLQLLLEIFMAAAKHDVSLLSEP
jgi:hypothetical protein